MKTQNAKSALQKGLLLSSALLILIVTVIGWLWDYEIAETSLSQLWKSTDQVIFLCSMGLISVAMPCVAMRWRALFPPPANREASPGHITGVLCAAFLFNFALPGPIGEAISAWMVHRKSTISLPAALASLGMSRILGLSSACLIAGLVYWLAPFPIPPRWSTVLFYAAILLGCGAVLLLFVSLKPAILLRIIHYLLDTWMGQIKLLNRALNVVENLFDALVETATRGWRAYTLSLCWALVGHTMVAAGIYTATTSMGVDIAWSAVLFTYAASIAGSVAMFLLPGSSLGWDLLFMSTLAITGNIPVTAAAAVTAVVRIQQLLVAIAGGLFMWVTAGAWLEEFSSARETT